MAQPPVAPVELALDLPQHLVGVKARVSYRVTARVIVRVKVRVRNSGVMVRVSY